MVLLCHYVVHSHCTLLHCGIDVLQKRVPVSTVTRLFASSIDMRGTMPLACGASTCSCGKH
uniref:Uncharacterized protein n=1 Tax=Arundo donax TaxID=35708 RepID=A0A0A9E8W4_ARUDO